MQDKGNLDAADSGRLGHVQLSATEQKTLLLSNKLTPQSNNVDHA
jgi:hypothetical protein